MTLRVLISSVFLVAASTSLCMAATAGDYLKEKKQAAVEVNRVAAKGSDDATAKANAKALEKLQTTLAGMIPQHQVKTFPAAGKITPETLLDGDQGSGGLDGLVYATPDGQKHLIVTTKSLLEAWLKGFRQSVKLPANLAGVLSADAFYGGAINSGDGDAVTNASSVFKYTDVPVKVAKAGTVAKAILFMNNDADAPPPAPDQIGVAVVQGDRVYVRWEKMTSPAIPECVSAFTAEADNGGEVAFAQCYAARVAKQGGYEAVVKRAQGIVDELADAPQ